MTGAEGAIYPGFILRMTRTTEQMQDSGSRRALGRYQGCGRECARRRQTSSDRTRQESRNATSPLNPAGIVGHGACRKIAAGNRSGTEGGTRTTCGVRARSQRGRRCRRRTDDQGEDECSVHRRSETGEWRTDPVQTDRHGSL